MTTSFVNGCNDGLCSPQLTAQIRNRSSLDEPNDVPCRNVESTQIILDPQEFESHHPEQIQEAIAPFSYAYRSQAPSPTSEGSTSRTQAGPETLQFLPGATDDSCSNPIVISPKPAYAAITAADPSNPVDSANPYLLTGTVPPTDVLQQRDTLVGYENNGNQLEKKMAETFQEPIDSDSEISVAIPIDSQSLSKFPHNHERSREPRKEESNLRNLGSGDEASKVLNPEVIVKRLDNVLARIQQHSCSGEILAGIWDQLEEFKRRRDRIVDDIYTQYAEIIQDALEKVPVSEHVVDETVCETPILTEAIAGETSTLHATDALTSSNCRFSPTIGTGIPTVYSQAEQPLFEKQLQDKKVSDTNCDIGMKSLKNTILDAPQWAGKKKGHTINNTLSESSEESDTPEKDVSRTSSLSQSSHLNKGTKCHCIGTRRPGGGASFLTPEEANKKLSDAVSLLKTALKVLKDCDNFGRLQDSIPNCQVTSSAHDQSPERWHRKLSQHVIRQQRRCPVFGLQKFSEKSERLSGYQQESVNVSEHSFQGGSEVMVPDSEVSETASTTTSSTLYPISRFLFSDGDEDGSLKSAELMGKCDKSAVMGGHPPFNAGEPETCRISNAPVKPFSARRLRQVFQARSPLSTRNSLPKSPPKFICRPKYSRRIQEPSDFAAAGPYIIRARANPSSCPATFNNVASVKSSCTLRHIIAPPRSPLQKRIRNLFGTSVPSSVQEASGFRISLDAKKKPSRNSFVKLSSEEYTNLVGLDGLLSNKPMCFPPWANSSLLFSSAAPRTSRCQAPRDPCQAHELPETKRQTRRGLNVLEKMLEHYKSQCGNDVRKLSGNKTTDDINSEGRLHQSHPQGNVGDSIIHDNICQGLLALETLLTRDPYKSLKMFQQLSESKADQADSQNHGIEIRDINSKELLKTKCVRQLRSGYEFRQSQVNANTCKELKESSKEETQLNKMSKNTQSTDELLKSSDTNIKQSKRRVKKKVQPNDCRKDVKEMSQSRDLEQVIGEKEFNDLKCSKQAIKETIKLNDEKDSNRDSHRINFVDSEMSYDRLKMKHLLEQYEKCELIRQSAEPSNAQSRIFTKLSPKDIKECPPFPAAFQGGLTQRSEESSPDSDLVLKWVQDALLKSFSRKIASQYFAAICLLSKQRNLLSQPRYHDLIFPELGNSKPYANSEPDPIRAGGLNVLSKYPFLSKTQRELNHPEEYPAARSESNKAFNSGETKAGEENWNFHSQSFMTIERKKEKDLSSIEKPGSPHFKHSANTNAGRLHEERLKSEAKVSPEMDESTALRSPSKPPMLNGSDLDSDISKILKRLTDNTSFPKRNRLNSVTSQNTKNSKCQAQSDLEKTKLSTSGQFPFHLIPIDEARISKLLESRKRGNFESRTPRYDKCYLRFATRRKSKSMKTSHLQGEMAARGLELQMKPLEHLIIEQCMLAGRSDQSSCCKPRKNKMKDSCSCKCSKDAEDTSSGRNSARGLQLRSWLTNFICSMGDSKLNSMSPNTRIQATRSIFNGGLIRSETMVSIGEPRKTHSKTIESDNFLNCCQDLMKNRVTTDSQLMEVRRKRSKLHYKLHSKLQRNVEGNRDRSKRLLKGTTERNHSRVQLSRRNSPSLQERVTKSLSHKSMLRKLDSMMKKDMVTGCMATSTIARSDGVIEKIENIAIDDMLVPGNCASESRLTGGDSGWPSEVVLEKEKLNSLESPQNSQIIKDLESLGRLLTSTAAVVSATNLEATKVRHDRSRKCHLLPKKIHVEISTENSIGNIKPKIIITIPKRKSKIESSSKKHYSKGRLAGGQDVCFGEVRAKAGGNSQAAMAASLTNTPNDVPGSRLFGNKLLSQTPMPMLVNFCRSGSSFSRQFHSSSCPCRNTQRRSFSCDHHSRRTFLPIPNPTSEKISSNTVKQCRKSSFSQPPKKVHTTSANSRGPQLFCRPQAGKSYRSTCRSKDSSTCRSLQEEVKQAKQLNKGSGDTFQRATGIRNGSSYLFDQMFPKCPAYKMPRRLSISRSNVSTNGDYLSSNESDVSDPEPISLSSKWASQLSVGHSCGRRESIRSLKRKLLQVVDHKGTHRRSVMHGDHQNNFLQTETNKKRSPSRSGYGNTRSMSLSHPSQKRRDQLVPIADFSSGFERQTNFPEIPAPHEKGSYKDRNPEHLADLSPKKKDLVSLDGKRGHFLGILNGDMVSVDVTTRFLGKVPTQEESVRMLVNLIWSEASKNGSELSGQNRRGTQSSPPPSALTEEASKKPAASNTKAIFKSAGKQDDEKELSSELVASKEKQNISGSFLSSHTPRKTLGMPFSSILTPGSGTPQSGIPGIQKQPEPRKLRPQHCNDMSKKEIRIRIDKADSQHLTTVESTNSGSPVANVANQADLSPVQDSAKQATSLACADQPVPVTKSRSSIRRVHFKDEELELKRFRKPGLGYRQLSAIPVSSNMESNTETIIDSPRKEPTGNLEMSFKSKYSGALEDKQSHGEKSKRPSSLRNEGKGDEVLAKASSSERLYQTEGDTFRELTVDWEPDTQDYYYRKFGEIHEEGAVRRLDGNKRQEPLFPPYFLQNETAIDEESSIMSTSTSCLSDKT